MVYNDDPVVGPNDVRFETGNLLPTDVTDAMLVKKINAAYGDIQMAASRDLDDPFVSGTDVEYYPSKEKELIGAAMYALKAYGPEFQGKIKELRDEFETFLERLEKRASVTIDVEESEELIERTSHKSWNYGDSEYNPPNRLLINTGSNIESQN